MNEHIVYLVVSAVTITSTFIGLYCIAYRLLNIKPAEEQPDEKIKALKPDKGFLSIQEKAENAVVQIFSVSSIFNWLQPYKAPIQITVSGSGFFVNEEGYFITNSHVVDNAKSIWIQVPILGRRNLDADIISVCPDSDLALLKIRKEGLEEIKATLGSLPFLELGDSDHVSRTDKILVLGYPLGQHYLKATTGIVSGKENIEEQLFFQIDAAINPGSSGGPVLNEDGKVIGITTVMIPSAQNVGYIIPITQLKIILEDMYSIPFYRKQVFGIEFHNATIEQVKYLQNPMPGGLFVNKVYKNSLAEKAGILPGDMIYEINKCKVDIYGDVKVPWSSERIPFVDIVSRFQKNEEIQLELYREGKKVNLKFKFDGGTLYPIRIMYPEYEKIDYEIIGGLIIMELSENHVHTLFPMVPELIKYENPENKIEPHLIISYIFPGSEIHRLRTLAPGNIIESINEKVVKTLDDFRDAIKLSLNTGYLIIKTSDAFVVLNIMHVLRDEYRLSQDYKYPLSETIQQLIAAIQMSHIAEQQQNS